MVRLWQSEGGEEEEEEREKIDVYKYAIYKYIRTWKEKKKVRVSNLFRRLWSFLISLLDTGERERGSKTIPVPQPNTAIVD